MSPAAAPRPRTAKLDVIQVLRALAASMVIVGHIIGGARLRPETFGTVPRLHYGGGVGVDIFFLISGFIMVYASGRMFGSVAGSGDFLMRRLVRIVPLYWGVTMLVLLLLVVGHDPLPSATGIAASFAFIPFDTLGRGDGTAFPIVELGWTLNYEMMFYVVFALFIPLGRTRGVASVAVVMAVLVALGMAMDPQATALRFWTQPLILEFVIGMGVAMAHLHGRIALGPFLRVALVVVAIALYLADPCRLVDTPQTPSDFQRIAGWGVPSLMLLIAAVGGPVPLESRAGRAVVLLGDASYALYLLHPFAIAAMVRVAGRPQFPGANRTLIYVVATFIVACVASIVVHKLVERPVTTMLTRWFQRRGAPIKAVPLTPDATLAHSDPPRGGGPGAAA